MSLEVEAKFRITPQQATQIQSFLRKEKATKLGNRFETNVYFDTKKSDFKKKGKAIRLRSIQKTDLKTRYARLLDEHILTVKTNSKLKSKYKSKIEHELTGLPYDTTLNILKVLNLQPVLIFQKKRISYKYKNAKIEIDQIPIIGYFCEIETNNEKLIKEILKDIKCENVKLIKIGYPSIINKFNHKIKQLSFIPPFYDSSTEMSFLKSKTPGIK